MTIKAGVTDPWNKDITYDENTKLCLTIALGRKVTGFAWVSAIQLYWLFLCGCGHAAFEAMTIVIFMAQRAVLADLSRGMTSRAIFPFYGFEITCEIERVDMVERGVVIGGLIDLVAGFTGLPRTQQVEMRRVRVA